MLSIALKEWAVVVDMLAAGELMFLLRKGGIHEIGGPGVFELEHPRFALWPAWMHQKPDMLKAPYRERVETFGHEPDEVPLRAVAHATHIWQVPSRQALDPLDPMHPWAPAQIDMRFTYKPRRPVYLVALRVALLEKEQVVVNNVEYAGCRSWVELHAGDEVDDSRARPVLDDEQYEQQVATLQAAMQPTPGNHP